MSDATKYPDGNGGDEADPETQSYAPTETVAFDEFEARADGSVEDLDPPGATASLVDLGRRPGPDAEDDAPTETIDVDGMRTQRDRPRDPSLSASQSEADLSEVLASGSDVHDAPALEPGTEINRRYIVGEVLGRGGMGVVYRVTDQINPDRPVALKTLSGAAVAKQQLDLFKTEFRTMTQLSHPGVVEVYDLEPIHGTDDYLLTLKYIPGKDIFKATRGAPWQRIVDLAVEICRALAYMHSRHIVHFDLKPGNILVDADGRAKILDFGIAGAKPRSSTGGISGTPGYMAPELMLDNPSVDHRYDLYSLGVVLYKLLTRKAPFRATSARDLMRLHCWFPIQFDDTATSRLPGWLIGVVTRLCAKDPNKRYRSANEVIEAINRLGGLAYEIETQETRESYIASSRFVGRHKEFERVVDFVTQRTRGTARSGPVLAVAGPSGIGKSRLMREIRYHAQLSDVPFIEVDCYEDVGSEFGPITSTLEHLVRTAETFEARALLVPLEPILRRHAPHLSPDDEPDSRPVVQPLDRQAELELICNFMVEAARLHPYTLYVNDAQWARVATVDVLSYLVARVAQVEGAGQRAGRVPIAIVVSYRDDEVEDRPIERFIQLLDEGGVGERVRLGHLGPDDVRAAISSMLGAVQLPPDFVTRIVSATDGNPFFVEEVMRVLVERGHVAQQHGQWVATSAAGHLEIPSIGEVFLERAALLDAGERRVLDVLAVCGVPVAPDVIQRVTGLDLDTLNRSLAALGKRHMAQRLRSEKVLFRTRHDRIRTSLYQALDADAATQLHHAIAAAYEAVYAGREDDHLYEMAHHYGRSSNEAKSLEYHIRAGEKASQRYENHLGIQYFQHSLDLLARRGQRDTPKWLELTEKLGDVYFRTGALDRATRLFERRLESCHDKMDRARLLQKLGETARERGEVDVAGEHVWAALAILGVRRPRSNFRLILGVAGALLVHLVHRAAPWLVRQVGDATARTSLEAKVRLYFAITKTYFHRDPLQLALAGFRASNLMDRNRLGDPALRVEADLTVGLLWVGLGMNAKADFFLGKGTELAAEAGLEELLTTADGYLSLVRYMEGDWDECIRLSEACLDKSLEWGDFVNYGAVSTNVFNPLYFRGELRYARRNIESAFAVQERTGTLLFGYFWRIQRCVLQVLVDEKDVQAEFDALEKELSDLTLWLLVGDLFYRAADVSLQRGDYETSLIYCHRLEKEIIQDRNFANGFFAIVYPLLARSYLEKYRVEAERLDASARKRTWKMARKYTRKAARVAKKFPIYRSWSQLALGEMHWLDNRRDAAEAAFSAAAAEAEKLGARLWLGHARFSAGHYYLADPATAARGADLLDEAARIFASCEASLWSTRIAALTRSDAAPTGDDAALAARDPTGEPTDRLS